MTLLTLPADLELPVLQPPRKPNRYGPDNPPPGKGRKRGTINKITRDLKEGVMAAAAACGYDGEGLGGVDGFLLMCAQRYPKHYLALLGKMLPLQSSAAIENNRIGSVNIISIPSGRFLAPEEIAKLQEPAPVIEHGPQPEPERFMAPEEPIETEELPIESDPHVVRSQIAGTP
jgi:hypothetical protein